MSVSAKRPALGTLVYVAVIFTLGVYFAFASVQGDYGLFRRIQIQAERDTLDAQSQALSVELADMRNKTQRMSDDFLDLDLLDEQAREVLGLVRADEIVIR